MSSSGFSSRSTSAIPAHRSADDQFASCPFYRRVRRTIDQLGIDVELRDILLDECYRDELIAERGRATVPVLRIASPDGGERCMPESADIIAYLEELYRRPE